MSIMRNINQQQFKSTKKCLGMFILALSATAGAFGFNLIQVQASDLASTQVLQLVKSTNPVLTNNAKPAPNIKIMVNNKPATLTDPIIMDNERVFLPLRSLGDLLNINVDYIANIKVAKAQNAKTFLELPLGYNQAVKNKTLILPIDTSNKNTRIISYNSRTYLPVRFISENLGYQISYGNNTVSITTDGTVPVIPEKPVTPPAEVKPPVTTPDSSKPPTSPGKKDRERSKDNRWEWVSGLNEWLWADPALEGPQIDHGHLDLDGPNNGNWE
ncbi:MAG TPA: copper amine oxidase N-terminal domain-containing protein [Epulopiscium sp.]|nr:copper amine oxidase N-terminal domain-containing protein [Candidatus Epulonipiscium sp.]